MTEDYRINSKMEFKALKSETHVDESNEELDEDEDSSILTLPTELRIMVFKNLPYEDTLNLRLVCKTIKQEVEEHMEFHIRIDQAYRGFRKLCKYRVRSCNVIHLTHHLHRGGLFAHPSRLRRIIFDGNISQTNLLKIFSFCSEIEHLVFTHETLGIENLLDNCRLEQSLQRNLSCVTYLNVQLLRYPLGDPFELDKNMDVIFSLTLPCLKTFKLYFSLWGKWLPLLQFLERHSGTLNDIELQVGDRGDSKNTEIFLNSHPHSMLRSSVNMKTLKTLQLKKFNFRDDVLNLNSTVRQILVDILQEQKALEVIQFHSPGDMTISHITNMASKNALTLTEIVIYNLRNFIPNNNNNNNNDNPVAQQVRLTMDMSIFQRCVNLKTLALSCTSSNGQLNNGIDLGNIRLLRLDLVPSAVERIHLTGFLLDIQEVIDFSRQSSNLKELLIADAGSMKYSLVLGSFLRNCPNLEYLNVRPVATRANSDAGWWKEVEELSNLYMHFMGIPFDPIDDLEGFEAKINDQDRTWLKDNIVSDPSLTPSISIPSASASQ